MPEDSSSPLLTPLPDNTWRISLLPMNLSKRIKRLLITFVACGAFAASIASEAVQLPSQVREVLSEMKSEQSLGRHQEAIDIALGGIRRLSMDPAVAAWQLMFLFKELSDSYEATGQLHLAASA